MTMAAVGGLASSSMWLGGDIIWPSFLALCQWVGTCRKSLQCMACRDIADESQESQCACPAVACGRLELRAGLSAAETAFILPTSVCRLFISQLHIY